MARLGLPALLLLVCVLAPADAARTLLQPLEPRWLDLPAANKTLPFVVLHGIGDACNRAGVAQFTSLLSTMSGAPGVCIEIGDGASSSWLLRLDRQVDEVCRKIKADKSLQGGFNLVGLSQGNVIGRGYIEWCEGGPKVQHFISLGGPHAGTASVPLCNTERVCHFIDDIIGLGIYSPFVQEHIAPTGYVKIPTELQAYLRGCSFLPALNNELPHARKAAYKERFAALEKLVLIQFTEDGVLIPPSTAWFGFYAPNSLNVILPPQQTELYKEDWIGLRSLDEAGRVEYVATPGQHLHITKELLNNHVVPWLKPCSLADQ